MARSPWFDGFSLALPVSRYALPIRRTSARQPRYSSASFPLEKDFVGWANARENGSFDEYDVVGLHVDSANREIHRAEDHLLRVSARIALDEHLVVLEAPELALLDIFCGRRGDDHLGRRHLDRESAGVLVGFGMQSALSSTARSRPCLPIR